MPNLLLKSSYRFLRHSILQLAVLLVTVNILWDEPVTILPERYWAWLVYMVLFNSVIYMNMYCLVPRFLLQGRAKMYIGLTFAVILFFILCVGMLQSISQGQDPTSPPTRAPVWIGLISGLASFALFIAGLTNLQLFKYLLENKARINELENATMRVELANLQNQINPHFLFNMLNNANIMATEDVERSSYMLSKLNDLLRYQVEKGSQKRVKLHQEITLLKDYLSLEKLRRDRFDYSIKVQGDVDIEVPPLLFIPFVENSVKHNPEHDSFVEVVFNIDAKKLYFECKNPKAKYSMSNKEGGIGLDNIKRRLALLFDSKFTLTLKDETSIYTAILELEYEMYHSR